MNDHELISESLNDLHYAKCKCGATSSVIDYEAAKIWCAVHSLWPELWPIEIAEKLAQVLRPVFEQYSANNEKVINIAQTIFTCLGSNGTWETLDEWRKIPFLKAAQKVIDLNHEKI